MRLVPAWIVLPVLYIGAWKYFPKTTLKYNLIALGLVIAVALGLGVVALHDFFKESDVKGVSLTREWLKTRKSRVCHQMKVQF